MRTIFAAASLLMLPVSAAFAAGAVHIPASHFTKPAPRGEHLFRQAMLDGHNTARAQVAVGPLSWNPRLEAEAQAYARELAETSSFDHAQQNGDDPQGENLWMGTRRGYSYTEMVSHWLDERKNFRHAPAPHFSTTGEWSDVGHYAQIVWQDTREVGCAVASNASDDYLVCRYYPAGNVQGEVPYRPAQLASAASSN